MNLGISRPQEAAKFMVNICFSVLKTERIYSHVHSKETCFPVQKNSFFAVHKEKTSSHRETKNRNNDNNNV